jgi:CTP synthase (UTP-ammonia lyase)
VHSTTKTLRIGVIGKYVTMPDAYLSVAESIRHAGFAVGAKTKIEWLEAERVPARSTPNASASSTASSCRAASASAASRA